MTAQHLHETRPRRVAIIDDSRTIRALLRATLDADPRLQVVGEAGDPYEAREMIKSCNPDVLTLDVEMPRMNGLVFLEHLMRLRPMPVVMVSNRTREHSEDAVRALSIGAVDCVDVARIQADPAQRTRLVDALFHASGASVRQPGEAPKPAVDATPDFRWNGRIVLIGSSTGGVDALERVFAHFPENCPPTLVAQHMPAAFLRSFAARLDAQIAPSVRVAAGGEALTQGTVLIAPGGGDHLAVEVTAENRTALMPATGTELHVPSVDVLFNSARRIAPQCLAVVLTGMGRDGAEATQVLRAGGAGTIVQSPETCVIDGMPRAVRDLGAAQHVVPLDAIGPAILKRCSTAGWSGHV